MNVASLELCKELYELSGWDNTDCEFNEAHEPQPLVIADKTHSPAYDLGYLLRKLPAHISVEFQKRVEYEDEGQWSWSCVAQSPDGFYWVEDGWLEDAAAKLCIELFKQGILK